MPADALELAIEVLAERLHRAMEQMECGDDDWRSIGELDREFYRQSVQAILLDRETVEAALREMETRP